MFFMSCYCSTKWGGEWRAIIKMSKSLPKGDIYIFHSFINIVLRLAFPQGKFEMDISGYDLYLHISLQVFIFFFFCPFFPLLTIQLSSLLLCLWITPLFLSHCLPPPLCLRFGSLSAFSLQACCFLSAMIFLTS